MYNLYKSVTSVVMHKICVFRIHRVWWGLEYLPSIKIGERLADIFPLLSLPFD